MGDDAVVVTVFPDSNKKYLSTDLLREEPVRDGYISPETDLIGFSALPRVCSGCIDYRPAPLAGRFGDRIVEVADQGPVIRYRRLAPDSTAAAPSALRFSYADC